MKRFSDDPENKTEYTERFDRYYSRFARAYDAFVKLLPIWRNWLRHALPELIGERVLEVSFGTGYLLTQYANRFESFGIDYNRRMATIASGNMKKRGIVASLQVGSVEAIPYQDASFDAIVNTMSFSGYPDGELALSEMRRVLKPGGRLVMIDINFPANGSWPGTLVTKAWQSGGDLVRDMGQLFRTFDFKYTDKEIGGFGSVHLYVATKQGNGAQAPLKG